MAIFLRPLLYLARHSSTWPATAARGSAVLPVPRQLSTRSLKGCTGLPKRLPRCAMSVRVAPMLNEGKIPPIERAVMWEAWRRTHSKHLPVKQCAKQCADSTIVLISYRAAGAAGGSAGASQGVDGASRTRNAPSETKPKWKSRVHVLGGVGPCLDGRPCKRARHHQPAPALRLLPIWSAIPLFVREKPICWLPVSPKPVPAPTPDLKS